MNAISLSISGTASLYDTAYRPNATPPENRPCPDSSDHTNDPDRSSENTPDRSGEPDSPKKDPPDTKTERCTVNTDSVDREIEKLKQKRQKLERQLRSETNAVKRKTAQLLLEQVERELSQKDNDAYRRQNAVYTYF